MEKLESKNPLIGLFFVSFTTDTQRRFPEYIGEVIGKISEELYLVQLFREDTKPIIKSEKRIFSIIEISNWIFYDDFAEWHK